uniref:3-hydroxyacyl-CoA dehydrogenase NAD-binding domain-containing protein n=1 Tax=uncultured Sphingomonas sp. TaxID=158754 RepID=UPI0035CA26B6
MSVITTEQHDGVLVIVSNNPPVNALGAAVRAGLRDALQTGLDDPRVSAMVIRCAGRTFFAGADITEFGKPPVDPILRDLLAAIEASPKPVVAAIHGTALGGGCELALACHYRIMVPSAQIGTPEVKLGLLPGAGGTQRIPRLAGVSMALEMVARGDPISASKALEAKLIDRIADEHELQADALTFARDISAVRPLPRTSEKDVAADPNAVAAFRDSNAKRFRGFEAPETAIMCVEAATRGSFTDGMAFERAAFLNLMVGTQSAAQRHIFFAERQAAKIDGIASDTAVREIKRVGVIGAGTMGGGIAMNFLSAGLPVTIVEMAEDALSRGAALIRKNYEASVAKGRLSAQQVEAAMDALTPTLDFDALKDCDLIVEAAYENMDVKKKIFQRLSTLAKPGAILASNTSYLNLNEIAASTTRPADVVGMHFFSPANVMKLLEIVRGAETADDVLATVMVIAKKVKKIAVVAGVCDGFIGNRILKARQSEALQLLLEGASPEQIDRVHVAFGMPIGPFQMADLAGVDIGWHRDPNRVESIRDALNAEGRWGQKKKAGFYDYDEKRMASPSSRVAEIINFFRSKTGTAQHEVTDQEIVERTLYPMINEGARILEEKMAQRASDIDVAWVYGYSWPTYRGGPMFWADTEGLAKVVAGLKKHGFSVSPLLSEKAAQDQTFI